MLEHLNDPRAIDYIKSYENPYPLIVIIYPPTGMLVGVNELIISFILVIQI